MFKRIWPTVRDYGLITIGIFIQAVGLRLFLIPAQLASGGISGVMAAYAVRYPEAQIGQAWFWGRVWLRLPAWAWLGLWLLGQLILAWQQVHGFTNVSAMAHLGGAAAGAGLAWWWGSGDRPAPTPSSSRSPGSSPR